jgi:hypothetical protein|tara:strand:+ start:1909 stop:2205 length:297 start_codon:yes stop_codon:yes gene_type:complete
MDVNKEIKDLLINYSIGNQNIDEHFLFGLKEIDEHTIELRELLEAKDLHLMNEIADLYIWSKMLLDSYDINEDVVLKRINRFKEKIVEKRKKIKGKTS